MKILIIGKNSYIGKKLEKFLLKKNYQVNLISLRFDFKDEELNLNDTDAVIHLSALVHKNEMNYKYEDYYNANVILPLKIAKLSEEKKIKHFIFMSSMAVFGKQKDIDVNILPLPKTLYGKSKFQAEVQLKEFFERKATKLSIIRSPVVFGKDAPGNPKILKKISRYSFFLPSIKNKKSIIFIESLLIHFERVIKGEFSVITHPQMDKLFSTSELLLINRQIKGKKSHLTSILNLFIYLFWFIPIVKKAFNSQYYNKESYKDKSELYRSDLNLVKLNYDH